MTKTVAIKSIGNIITGSTPPTAKKEFFGNDFLFIKPSDIIKGNKSTYTTETMLSNLSAETYSKLIIPKGSTCVVCIGSIGEKLTYAARDCFTNQQINSVIPNEKYDSMYVYYLLKHNVYKLKSANQGSSSGRENVSKTNFGNILVDVIENKNQQYKIGKILSAYDDLIENNQKQIKLLEEAAQRLYKEWFVDLRFPGYENVKVVDGVPEGWNVAKVCDFGRIVTGKTPSTSVSDNFGDDIPFVKIPDMHGSIFSVYTEQKLSVKGAETQKSKYIPRNSLMVSCIGTVGLVNISVEECQTNQQINSIILHNQEYIYYLYFVMKDMERMLDGLGSNGATMTNVNKEKFSNMRIIKPNNEIMIKYFECVAPMFEKCLVLYKSLKSAKEARDRLLPKLMSGEIEI